MARETESFSKCKSDTAAKRSADLISAWQEGWCELTAKPSLGSTLSSRGPQTWGRFKSAYEYLCTQPRRIRRRMQRQAKLTLSGIALLFALGSDQALAATIHVDGETCTLIEAIDSANSDTSVGGCASGSGDDVIELEPGSAHTLVEVNNDYHGPNGLPVVESKMTIEGHGSTIERDGAAPEFRLFYVSNWRNYDYWDDATLTIRDTTITGGRVSGSGGALQATYAGATLVNTVIAGNTASGGGGGLYGSSFSSLTLIDSVVSGNTAAVGGGIGGSGRARYSVGSALKLIDSNVSGNRALVSGGGISLGDRGGSISGSTISGNTSGSRGGGILAWATRLSVTNSTISGNVTGEQGGGIEFATSNMCCLYSENLSIKNTTISGNVAGSTGGGIASAYACKLVLSDSIVSGNEAANGAQVSAIASYEAVVDNYNLFGLSGDAGVVGFAPGPTDIVPAADVFLDDILDPMLADNGGPTLTHALVSGSPAIDAIPADDADCTGTDQRGVTRPQGAGCDIGAVELTDEAVSVVGKYNINHMWRKFCPDGFGSEAIVLLGPPTYNGENPGVVRMRPTEDAECPYQIRFQEWDYRQRDFDDQRHRREQVSYLGLAPGLYTMDDGSIWEVGSFQLSGTGVWKSVAFQHSVDGSPWVFLTMQSSNGGQAATVRAKAVSPKGFAAAIFEEESLGDSGHKREDIGYVAIYHPDADSSGAVAGQAELNGIAYPYTLNRTWVDNKWTRINGIELKLEEDQSRDQETAHREEMIDVLQIGGGVFAQQVTNRGKNTTALRRR